MGLKWPNLKRTKTLVLYDRLNWNADQIVTLKKLWNADFKVFPWFKNFKKYNFGKLPGTRPYTVFKIYTIDYILYIFHTGKMITVQSILWVDVNRVDTRIFWKKIALLSWIPLSEMCLYSELFRSAFFQHFPTFILNTERYSVSFRIQSQSECEETRQKYGPE